MIFMIKKINRRIKLEFFPKQDYMIMFHTQLFRIALFLAQKRY